MAEPAEVPGRPSYGVPLVLFVATLASTLMVGSNQPLAALAASPSAWLAGVPFAGTLMAILVVHEAGHYVLSRIHRVRASLPYFIPMPLTPIGTMGAIIFMPARIHHLRALLDIGAAGPIAGFVLAVPALFVGMHLSTPIDVLPEGGVLVMGDSLLVKLALATVGPPIPEGGDVMLHPVAFAGWIGLFVTSLNLLPAGQLDGGHVLYAFIAGRRVPSLERLATALERRRATARGIWSRAALARAERHARALAGNLHRTLGLALSVGLIGLGLNGWLGWTLWGALLLWFGARHPPTRDDVTPLDARRRAIGWLCLGIFVLSFIPVPFRVQ